MDKERDMNDIPTPQQICNELDLAATGGESRFSVVHDDGGLIPLSRNEATVVFEKWISGMNCLERINFISKLLDSYPMGSPGRITFARTINDMQHIRFDETRSFILSVIKDDPAKWWETLLPSIGTKELKDYIFLALDNYHDER